MTQDLETIAEPAVGAAPAETVEGRGVWLVALWSVAVLLHLAANPGHLLAMDGAGTVQLVMIGAAVACLAGAVRGVVGDVRSAVLAASVLVALWVKAPVIGNHEVLLGLFSLAVLIVIAAGARSGRRGEWPQAVVRPGRAVLLVSYGFIALSKLNADFFAAGASCASHFADAMLGSFGLDGTVAIAGPIPTGLVAAVVAGVEVAIPILLLVPRLRARGVAVALIFHFVLAIDPVSHVWDFSSVLLPLFLLFAPGVHERLDRLVGGLGRSDDRKPELAIVVVVALGAVVASGAVPGLGWLPTWVVAYPLWLGIGGGVCVVVVRALAADRWSTADGSDTTTIMAGPNGGPGVRVAAVVIIVVGVLNGLGPYLEYRTAAAFNMYANLHIADGRSNIC